MGILQAAGKASFYDARISDGKNLPGKVRAMGQAGGWTLFFDCDGDSGFDYDFVRRAGFQRGVGQQLCKRPFYSLSDGGHGDCFLASDCKDYKRHSLSGRKAVLYWKEYVCGYDAPYGLLYAGERNVLSLQLIYACV